MSDDSCDGQAPGAIACEGLWVAGAAQTRGPLVLERTDWELHKHAHGWLVVVEAESGKTGRGPAPLPRRVKPLDAAQASIAHFVQDGFKHHGQIVAVAHWQVGMIRLCHQSKRTRYPHA